MWVFVWSEKEQRKQYRKYVISCRRNNNNLKSNSPILGFCGSLIFVLNCVTSEQNFFSVKIRVLNGIHF